MASSVMRYEQNKFVGWRPTAALCLALAASAATAADPPPAPVSREAEEFILGNVVFVVMHEFGHAVIRDFGVPILGLEENSADTLATVTLIRAEQESGGEGETGRLASLLGMAAVGNVLTWRSGIERENPELIYWAQHDLSVRRATHIACLLLGSDSGRFGWLVESGAVPDIRADNCEDEYDVAAHAALWVGRTYGRFRNGKGVDKGREISVEYGDTGNTTQARILQRLREARVMDRLAAFYDAGFRFPKPLNVRLTRCGTPNAYWDADNRELRFCYELLDTFAKMSADPAVVKAYEAFRRKGDGGAD